MKHRGLVGLAVAVVAAASACAVPMGDLGGPTSGAAGINDAGVVVGSSEVAGSTPEHPVTHAFRRDVDGAVVDLGTLPGHVRSDAFRVNEVGAVVGTSSADGFGGHAVRWDAAGAITDLGTLGGPTSEPRDIDGQGPHHRVSDTATPGITKAFVFDPAVGHLVALPDLPGGGSSIALGMNDVGDAVGYQWVGSPGLVRAVRWDLDLGTATDLSATLGNWIASGHQRRRQHHRPGAVRIGADPHPGGGHPARWCVGLRAPERRQLRRAHLRQRGQRRRRLPHRRPRRRPRLPVQQMTGPVALTTDQASMAYQINDHDQIVGVADQQAAFLIPPPSP